MDISEFKVTEAKDLTEEQWESIALMDNYLKSEFYPQNWNGEKTNGKKIKDKVLKNIKLSDILFANNYYFFVNEKAVAYIEAFERKETLYFYFDYFDKEISVEFCEIAFGFVKKIMKEENFEQAMFYTFEERQYKPACLTDAEIYEEALTSRLLKENIDFAEMEKIVNGNNEINKFELKLFHTIPEEIFERYVEYINEIYEDSNEFHPNKEKPKKSTMNDLIAKVEDMKNDDSPYYLYMLFDGDNIAAFCGVFIDTADGKKYIEHRGGFTTTGRKYRGKGLARYLKAKMYLKIQEDFPDFEYVLTDTFPWNKYMYRINEEFGFEPFQKGYTFRLKI